MEGKAYNDGVYSPSEDVVGREIEEEFIIVPLVSGMGDLEDELFTLNETGKVIWKCLDGQTNLRDVTKKLAEEFDAKVEEIEGDVIEFVEELLGKGMLVEVSKG